MTLPVQTFTQVVAQQQSAMLASASQVLDFSPGAILLALVEANGGNFLWLQAIAVSLLATTRLSTSTGNDVDTFIQDYGFQRYQGSPSSGAVTFSRNIVSIAAAVPAGSIVSVSAVNNLTFIVTVDTSNEYWNPETLSYDLASSVASIIVPVSCQINGVIGNVLVGEIDTINSIIPGVDFVTNADAYTNGSDPWSDQQTKNEFVLYIQSLSRATYEAIGYIISVTPGVVRYNLVENYNTSNVPQLGFFYAVIDDGTGNASSGLIALVTAAVENYRGLTIQYSIIAPEPTTCDVSMTVTLVTNPTESEAIVTANIQAAIIAYINSLPINGIFPYTRLAELIYDADPNVFNVTSILLNAGTSDLNPSQDAPTLVFIPGTIEVSY